MKKLVFFLLLLVGMTANNNTFGQVKVVEGFVSDTTNAYALDSLLNIHSALKGSIICGVFQDTTLVQQAEGKVEQSMFSFTFPGAEAIIERCYAFKLAAPVSLKEGVMVNLFILSIEKRLMYAQGEDKGMLITIPWGTEDGIIFMFTEEYEIQISTY